MRKHQYLTKIVTIVVDILIKYKSCIGRSFLHYHYLFYQFMLKRGFIIG